MYFSKMDFSRAFQRLLVLWSVLHVFALINSPAQAVELAPGRGIADLGPHLKYHSDPQAKLSTILQRFRDGQFGSELKASMLASNYAPEAWAAVDITNATLADGRAPDPFALTLSLALPSAVNIYVVRNNGLTENLLVYSAFEAYVPQDHSVTRLRTPVFQIAPQETVTVLVNFKFGPFQSFRLAMQTPQELESSAFNAGILYAAFYAFSISCLVFFFGFNLAMKNRIGLFYVLLFGVGLAIVAYIDGLLFRFVYPDDPDWHPIIGFGLLFALSAIGFLLASRSVADGKETRLSKARISKILGAMAVLPLLGFLASLFSPGTYVAFFAYFLIVLMLGANLLAANEWKKRGGKIQIGAQLVTGLSVVSFGAVFWLMIVGWSAGGILVPDILKAVFAILLLATMVLLTAHIINLRRLHAKAVDSELAALKEEAQRSQELLSAEKNYSRARDLANLRQRQLATASHDLKQPIASLRMTFDAIAENTTPEIRQRLRESFDYMEALSVDYLEKTMPENNPLEGSSPGEVVPEEAETEAYELSIIVGTVQQMFQEEAVSKGLRLRTVNSSVKVQTPPIVLMRIASNLVSNAVKYTLSGSVLVGVRCKEAQAVLQIIDTGAGMDANEIERFKQSYKKGGSSQGQGLGLAVCHDLAEQHGLKLTVTSQKNVGTCFSLSIPRK